VGWSAPTDVTAALMPSNEGLLGDLIEGLEEGIDIAGDPAAAIVGDMVTIFARAFQMEQGGLEPDNIVQFSRPIAGGDWAFASTGLETPGDPSVIVTGATIRVYALDFSYNLNEVQIDAGVASAPVPITLGMACAGQMVGVASAVADADNVYVFARDTAGNLWMLTTPLDAIDWTATNISSGYGVAADPGALLTPEGGFFVYARGEGLCLMEFRLDPGAATWMASTIDVNDISGRPVPYLVATEYGPDTLVLVTSATLVAPAA
jgi:hypothetical protein